MKKAFQKDESLLAEIASAADDENSFTIWWLGQSGFLIHWNGSRLLFDPYLSDSLTRKYADTDKPHTRMTEQVVNPARLENVMVATSSHNHTDHLDAETLNALTAANSALSLVIPEANIEFARSRLGDASPAFLGIDDGTEVTAGRFTFRGIPAAHNEVSRDDLGRCQFVGFVVRFGDFVVYHSGDTLLHDHLVPSLKKAAEHYDLMMLPINGNKPERRVAGNLDGREAASLARACNTRMVVPCHYDMFTFNTATTDLFEHECNKLNQPYIVLENGQSWQCHREA